MLGRGEGDGNLGGAERQAGGLSTRRIRVRLSGNPRRPGGSRVLRHDVAAAPDPEALPLRLRRASAGDARPANPQQGARSRDGALHRRQPRRLHLLGPHGQRERGGSVRPAGERGRHRRPRRHAHDPDGRSLRDQRRPAPSSCHRPGSRREPGPQRRDDRHRALHRHRAEPLAADVRRSEPSRDPPAALDRRPVRPPRPDVRGSQAGGAEVAVLPGPHRDGDQQPRGPLAQALHALGLLHRGPLVARRHRGGVDRQSGSRLRPSTGSTSPSSSRPGARCTTAR